VPEPFTLLLALAGIILVVYTFSTIDLVKDLGRTIALVMLAVMVVLMSDRLIPWFQERNFSFDRLPNLRYLLNPFAVRVAQPGWQDLPYLLSNQPLPERPVPTVPPRSRPPTTSSAANYPQTVEPYLNGGVAPPPSTRSGSTGAIVPPYSTAPASGPPAPPGNRPITGLW